MLVPNPVYKGEDKILMQVRAVLERAWFNDLTPTDRAAWLSRWLTRPPMDIQFRTYAPYTPTVFSMVQVLPQTSYAWSQIYGFYRYGNAIVTTPSDPIDPVLSMSNFNPHIDTLPMDYSLAPDPGAPYQIIYFASGPTGPTIGDGRAAVRPMCFSTQSDATETLDFINCWMLRYGGTPEGIITATAGFVNRNNELVPSPDTLQAEVEDP